MPNIENRLAALERLARPRDGVFVLSPLDGGNVELLQTGSRFMQQFFKNEVEALAHIPADATCIIDDL